MPDPRIENVHILYEKLKGSKISYMYRGNLSESLSDSILSLAEHKMEASGEPSGIRKKVYFIMVESLQNITRHKETMPARDADDDNYFLITERSDGYYITTGNRIKNSIVNDLKEKLDTINSLAGEELKTNYKRALSQGDFSEKGGAGLGLIEMARKTGNKLTYDFVKTPHTDYSYFYFQTKMQKQANELPSPDSSEGLLDREKELHRLLKDRNLNIVYQGNFNQENMRNVLSMAEKNIGASEKLLLKKKIFNIIVEMIQNINKHADDPMENKEGKFGVFLLGRRKDHYLISAANLVRNSKVDGLRQRIEKINSLNTDTLEELFNETMQSGGETPVSNGLGFIDMRLKSGSELSYELKPVEEGYSLFSLQLKTAISES